MRKTERHATAPSARSKGVAPMAREDIIAHFATSHFHNLQSFRSLCNALKALSISEAARVWRGGGNKGRLSVCDLGCGKGGDIGKWMPHRPKKLIGLDGSAQCIKEAAERHAAFLSKGRGSMQATFHCQDLCDLRVALPAADGEMDIVCSHFFMQFAMESPGTLQHVLSEASRVCKPGGALLCLVPDGDRVLSLLTGPEVSVRFGHFVLSRCAGATYSAAGVPYGLAYSFTLGDETCTEYLVPPLLLERHLLEAGFEPVCAGAALSHPAQQFFLGAPDSEGLVEGIMKGQSGSHMDWLSLALFRVFLVRRSAPEAPAAEEASTAPEEAAARAHKRGARRDTKRAARKPLASSGGAPLNE